MAPLLNPSLLAVLLLPALACATVVTDDSTIIANRTFDYVVVGAGLTGITVANKLSGEGFSVLIIEAGEDARWNPAVYNAEDRVFGSSICNWKYTAFDEDGQELPAKIDSGRCIGGSTSINGMDWLRPTKAEADHLESLGNEGWNWDTLVPYMTDIEHFHPPDETQSEEGAAYVASVHGYSGPINVSFPIPMRVPALQALTKRAIPLVFPGLAVGPDLSSRTATASASTVWTVWNDPATNRTRRSSAADGLLWAAGQQRAALTVLANHTVDRVLLARDAPAPPRATGVAFAPAAGPGAPSTVFAGREVILAAGALGTAPILERSGIGARHVLAGAGIEQVVDLPGVGVNLNDQPGTGTGALLKEAFWNDTGITDNRSLFAPEISLVNIDQLWSAAASTYAADLVTPDALRSRAQALVDSGSAVTTAGAERILNATIDLVVTDRISVVEFISESFSNTLSADFWPSMPLSRGHVHINTTDPFSYPIITPRLLTDAFDQQIAIQVARKSRDMYASDVFAEIVEDPYYSPPIGANGTDEQYLEWYLNSSYGASHWIGSTSMLPRHLGGVVDPQLRVYGTQGLRVVDAGILPFQITSHLMSMLYSTSSRAADIILGRV